MGRLAISTSNDIGNVDQEATNDDGHFTAGACPLHAGGEAVNLIDVRTPAEFREIHVPFAKNVPLDRLELSHVAAVCERQFGQPVYVICLSGARGAKACENLSAAGLKAVNIEGGTLACAAADLPVVRGKKAIALERQVRIAARSLVVLGCALAAR